MYLSIDIKVIKDIHRLDPKRIEEERVRESKKGQKYKSTCLLEETE